MIKFYTKPGCHLCQDVEEVLDELGEQHVLAIESIDITQNADAYSRLWVQIPVVEIGNTRLQAPITPDALRNAVAQTVAESK